MAIEPPGVRAAEPGPGMATARRSRRTTWLLVAWAIVVFAALYAAYRLVDPLPPRRLVIAAGPAGASYDDYARQYARVLARHGIQLEVRNYEGSLPHFDALRDAGSGVQAAITTFGFTRPDDAETLYSLGGISVSPIFVFYRGSEPISQLAQLRGKRLSIGMPATALRSHMLQALEASGALDASTRLVDLDYAASVDALIAGEIDAAMLPLQLSDEPLRRALGAPGVRLMNVAQAEAVSKAVPGLKHVTLWRGLVSLAGDVPDRNVELLAVRNRVIVRRDLHPALQYLLLEAMREVHSPAGAFHQLAEFPAQQSNDLPLSPVAETFYRSGPSFWQRYATFWLSSLLDRFVFFVIPVLLMLVPVLGIAPRVDRWLHLRRIGRLHRELGDIQHELDEYAGATRSGELGVRLAEIESAIRSLRIARRFDGDLQQLRIHLRMAREDLDRIRHRESDEQTGASMERA